MLGAVRRFAERVNRGERAARAIVIALGLVAAAMTAAGGRSYRPEKTSPHVGYIPDASSRGVQIVCVAEVTRVRRRLEKPRRRPVAPPPSLSPRPFLPPRFAVSPAGPRAPPCARSMRRS